MTIRQIFQPLAMRKFPILEAYSKFDDFIIAIEPDGFNEETECSNLDIKVAAGIIVQFSIMTGISIVEISNEYIQCQYK